MIHILPSSTLPEIPSRVSDTLREPEESIYRFLLNIYLMSEDCLKAYEQINLAIQSSEWITHDLDGSGYGFKEAFDDLMILYDEMVVRIRRFLSHYESLNGYRVIDNDIDVKSDGVYVEIILAETAPEKLPSPPGCQHHSPHNLYWGPRRELPPDAKDLWDRVLHHSGTRLPRP